MNLFRSEEHLDRWLAGRGPGATMTVAALASVAVGWFEGRLAPDWRPRSVEESQAILERAGLTGEFWRLG
jgi:hypothetical protein